MCYLDSLLGNMNVIKIDIVSWEIQLVEFCPVYVVPTGHQRSLMPRREIWLNMFCCINSVTQVSYSTRSKRWKEHTRLSEGGAQWPRPRPPRLRGLRFSSTRNWKSIFCYYFCYYHHLLHHYRQYCITVFFRGGRTEDALEWRLYCLISLLVLTRYLSFTHFFSIATSCVINLWRKINIPAAREVSMCLGD
jgi:hypothetical protein